MVKKSARRKQRLGKKRPSKTKRLGKTKRYGKTKRHGKTKGYSRKSFYKRSKRSKSLIGGEMQNVCLQGHPCPLTGEGSKICTSCGGSYRKRDIKKAWTGRVRGDGGNETGEGGGNYQYGG